MSPHFPLRTKLSSSGKARRREFRAKGSFSGNVVAGQLFAPTGTSPTEAIFWHQDDLCVNDRATPQEWMSAPTLMTEGHVHSMGQCQTYCSSYLMFRTYRGVFVEHTPRLRHWERLWQTLRATRRLSRLTPSPEARPGMFKILGLRGNGDLRLVKYVFR